MMGTINSNIDFTLASKKTTINTEIVLNPFAHLRDFFDVYANRQDEHPQNIFERL